MGHLTRSRRTLTWIEPDGSIRTQPNMRILIIGSGGREHAIVWAIRNTQRSPVEIFCAPGNAGIAQIAQTVEVSVNAHTALAEFAASEKIDLTFVGPEAPLATGIVDLFTERGLRIVGPTRAASRLEGSKIFAKDFMTRHQIPTAAYRVAESPQAGNRVSEKRCVWLRGIARCYQGRWLSRGKGCGRSSKPS